MKPTRKPTHKPTRRPIRGDRVAHIPQLDVEEFEKSMNDLIDFCSMINEQNNINQTLMKNYVIIRLVSIVEFHLKAFISELIDDLDLRPDEVIIDDSISIETDVLQHFKSEFYTKGRIITALLDKMNPGIIYSIMSRINRLDYFRWYDSLVPSSQGKTYAQIKDLYSKRNDVVHNLADVDYSIPVLIDKIKTFKRFAYLLFIFTQMNIGINVKKWHESKITEKWSPIKKSNPKLTLDYYKRITKKFKDSYRPPRMY